MRPISSRFTTAFAWLAILAVPMLALAVTGHVAHAQHLLHVSPLLIGATNTFGNYNETFFAQEALIQLEKALGMANRVYRGFEPNPQIKGNTINVRRPSTFVANDAPSTDQNITTDSLSITLDQWKEVKFSITDKDLTLNSDRIIQDHIRPAAIALADKIDSTLAGRYIDIPWYFAMSATPALTDITNIKKIMFDNKVPMLTPAAQGQNQVRSDLHFQIGSAEAMAFQNALTTLSNPLATGLNTGGIPELYGFDVFANQNTPVFTSGVSADSTGDLAAASSVGDTTINLENITASGTVKAGDIVVITGDPQQYVVTANATASSGAIAALAIAPAIKNASLINAVVNVFLGGASKNQNLAFHTNAFCLAMAPLSDLGGQLGGARIAVVSDAITNISLRSRMFYLPDSSTVKVALDCLFGTKTLDVNMAVRGYAH